MRADPTILTSSDCKGGQASSLIYILITPARNEAKFIEQTIKSVIGQTILPTKWVIVSDGSTDGTDDIVKKYAAEYPWIKLVRMPERTERHFAGKVHAFNAGYAKVKDLQYECIGSLDADISFETDYFAFLLHKFEQMLDLGVAGTPFVEAGFQYDYNFVSIDHVSGACQLFRRRCFEDIGGYKPIRDGGIDWVAVTTARMKGWKTRTFTDRTCLHQRRIGTGKGNVFKAKFRVGQQDYYLGSHPLWEVFRALYQMTLRPYVLGGVLIYTGYLWTFLKRCERPIGYELVNFRRKEQMQRLKNVTFKLIGRGRAIKRNG
jgi:glycosyltransferase involved in cell wall biosynthesis